MSLFGQSTLLGPTPTLGAPETDDHHVPQASSTMSPNGLLGSLEASAPNHVDQPQSAILQSNGLLDTPSTNISMQPNGLLGSVPSVESSAMDFQSNGLLGSSSGLYLPSDSLLGSRSPSSTTRSLQDNESAFSVQSNGLLGSSSLSLRSNGLLDAMSAPSSEPDTPIQLPADDDQSSVSSFGLARSVTGSNSRTSPPPELAPVQPSAPLHSDLLSSSRQTISTTTFNGKTVHIKRKIRRTGESSGSTSGGLRTNNSKLLDVPIHRMMERLTLRKVDEISKPYQQEEKADIEETLWVDRYRPRKFTDLLGNERGAREAMTWLKQWDWCVFGKNKIKQARRKEEDANNVDEYHRPLEKFLLISGPPGLGKTTLAHVIAKQAGYDVLEINASDARTGNVVDDRIRPTLEAGSKVGSAKPVLVIIDEIDGATGAGDNSNTFAHKLLNLMNAKSRKKQRNGKRDNQGPRPILRPVICICNDINASSIAKLRPHALQIRFNKPTDVHVVKRLREICLMEGMKADARALATLVGVAKGDLRGCLNTLQFIKSKKEDVTEPMIRQATVGMKESEGSIQTVLNSLFTPLSKKRVKELGLSEIEERQYISRLYQEIDGCGRESGIATACFGHYASLRNHDANLSRHEKAIGWLSTFDTLSNAMYGDGDFTLHHYLPYTLIPFFPLFKERGGERIERNQADWDHMQLLRTNEEVYKTLGRSLRSAAVRNNGNYRHFGETPILQTEFTPLINRIISPPLRPVNQQIIKPEEKALLSRLVQLMAAVDLRFVRERSEEGQLSYRLDPPIDVFITYDGKRAPDIPVSRYAVRHLVAGEVDALLTERDTEYVEKGKKGKHADHFKQPGGRIHASPSKRSRDDGGEDEREAKRTKLDVEEEKPPTDFFGRRITAPTSRTSKFAPRKIAAEKPYRCVYKFAEGNSAAVRKPVKVEAFM